MRSSIITIDYEGFSIDVIRDICRALPHIFEDVPKDLILRTDVRLKAPFTPGQIETYEILKDAVQKRLREAIRIMIINEQIRINEEVRKVLEQR
jgi:hypothetical protein